MGKINLQQVSRTENHRAASSMNKKISTQQAPCDWLSFQWKNDTYRKRIVKWLSSMTSHRLPRRQLHKQN